MPNSKKTVKKITNRIEEIFPLVQAEKWDKVGLQIGSSRKNVQSIFIAFELTKEVLDAAIDNKSDLIITFHPFLFNESDFEKTPQQKWKNSIFHRLNNENIAVYSIHTAFDKEPKGMKKAMFNKLGLEGKLTPIKGSDFGILIKWENSIKKLMELFKNTFDIRHTPTNIKDLEMNIGNVAFIPGSGSIEDIENAWQNNNIDLVVTSDIKWSEWITIDQEKINVMEVSHIVEDVFTEHLTNFLKKSFKNISINHYKFKNIIKNI